MASTFTSNINLEKPAQGDQVDAWGTTVNSNSDIIDTQIANKLPLAGGTITGDVIFDGSNDITYDNSESKIKFHDSAKATFGNSDDLQIYHDGANSFIADASGTGDIKIRSSNVRMENATGTLGVFVDGSNNNVALYQSGNVKLQTTSSGISATGDIAVTGTVDGRDVATDGSKLDGIEASADVTDATNVNAAGAIMNSDVATKGQIIVGDGSGDPTILSVGTDGHYLKADSSAGSGVAWASVPAGVGGANGVDFNDGVKARFGDGNDLEIYHDGNDSYIHDGGTGDLIIRGTDNVRLTNTGGDNYLKGTNGAGVHLYNNGSEVAKTSANGLEIPSDNLELRLGASADLKLVHDGADSIISNSTGTLKIRADTVRFQNAAGTETIFGGTADGSSFLVFDDATKIATNSGGVTVTGTLTATTLSGSLPYSDLTGTPTIPTNNNQLTNGAGYTTYTSNQATDTTSGVSFSGVSINGNHDLTLNAGSWTGEKSGKIQRHSNHMYFQTANAGSWIFRNQSGSEFFNISASNGAATSSNNITAYSDIRLKKDVETIENALDKVCAMRGVMYTRKSNDEREVGVIAQEVKEIVPELVNIEKTDNSLSDNGLKDIHTMKYQNTVGLLIEAIKELKAEIEELKKR